MTIASSTSKQTPLFEKHNEAGARMGPFAGYQMPIQYSGIVEEHLAVRRAAGLFDVSHMGEVVVSGSAAESFVQRLVTNDAAKLADGRAMYTVMCREDGGIIDDLLVYRMSRARFMLVVNAANREKDLNWIRSNAEGEAVDIEDISDSVALIALQGPKTGAILEKVAPGLSLDSLRYYSFATEQRVGSAPDVLVSRTGYTGEHGVELYLSPDEALRLWDELLEAGDPEGLLPAGLGARDTLRLEAGLPLYGNELSDETNPLEAGLSWLVKFDKGPFVGRDALLEIREAGAGRRLVGFVLDGRGIPRAGYELTDGHRSVGIVTSGTQSPVLQRGIGLGYVAANVPAVPGDTLHVSIRGRDIAAHIVKPPFHKIHL